MHRVRLLDNGWIFEELRVRYHTHGVRGAARVLALFAHGCCKCAFERDRLAGGF